MHQPARRTRRFALGGAHALNAVDQSLAHLARAGWQMGKMELVGKPVVSKHVRIIEMLQSMTHLFAKVGNVNSGVGFFRITHWDIVSQSANLNQQINNKILSTG